jgi:2-keto-3-deoxy-galactonokinase
LHKQTAASNASYLSGLLIGYELRNLQADTVRAITLCADNPFMLRYQKALHLLGFIPPQLISEAEATLLGHQLVHRQIYQT